LSNLS